MIFPSCFYLIIVTSRNSPPYCENNLVKAVLVLHGEDLTGFKHNFIAPNGKTSPLDT